MPALDVKVVPADTDRFGVGHGYNTSPSDGTPAAIVERDGARSARRRSCSRAWRSGAAPESAHVVQRRVDRRRRRDPAQVKTIEDIALYAHGTGALPPGVEGGLDAQAVYRD